MAARSAQDLFNLLSKIDHQGYKAYREISGSWSFENFMLFIDHVQGDPFAAPSRLRVRVGMDRAGFPGDTYRPRSREIGFRDFLTRVFGDSCRLYKEKDGGSGKSGILEVDMPGQEVIERSSCAVSDEFVEIRFLAGLPAFGRRIAGRIARDMFRRRIPAIVGASLFYEHLDAAALYRAVETAEDADYLRNTLPEMQLTAFVADGAVLPRRSGIDPRPMSLKSAVPFTSPDSLRRELILPNRGKISGMGIPKGITLIVGGGYHGKSTLLNAIELGVYNHIPGDGREYVVSDPAAFKIRAEDGRRIEKTTISPFIANLPGREDTDAFCSENASGSTSQAANIIEAIEAGATTLLIDEDTSATNFMIRDHRMQELISKDLEPITPFIDKVRQLYQERDVSTILVIGGSGDYFDVSDLVIGMKAYTPIDLSEEARRIAEKYRSERTREGGKGFGRVNERLPLAGGIDPGRGRRDVKIGVRGPRLIEFGREHIDLTSIEQLMHPGQARAIAWAMVSSRGFMDGTTSLRQVLERVEELIEREGLDGLMKPGGGGKAGDLVRFRPLELAAALNRLRSFRARQSD